MIWLIGNKGMLGTDVDENLKDAGLDYFATDKEVDITDFEALENYVRNKNISWIVNCSAYTAVDKAEDESDLAFRINAEGVLNLAGIAEKADARLIHISTDYVFDGNKDGEYIEDDEPNPTGIYGKSKLQGEVNIINNLAGYFILRISWLFGLNGNNFVYTMLRLFGERDEVRVVSDQWGSPTCAIDVADIIIKIISVDSQKYGIYNFTNEGRTNWHEFACEIYCQARKYGLLDKEVRIVPVKTEDFPTKARRPKNSYLSKEKIKSSFGIRIRGWKEAVEEFVLCNK